MERINEESDLTSELQHIYFCLEFMLDHPYLRSEARPVTPEEGARIEAAWERYLELEEERNGRP